jgi:glutamate-ammonia-ligase adenylyltransferase
MNFPHTIAIPDALKQIVDDRISSHPDIFRRLLESPDEQLNTCWTLAIALSDYVADSCRSHPHLADQLVKSGALLQSIEDGVYRTNLSEALKKNPDDIATLLREFRRREMIRIIFRDLNRIADLEETMRDLSNLADACVSICLDVLYKQHCKKYGTPIGAMTNTAQQMMVLALGKLGAGELNLSSDIDLIFFYDQQGDVATTSAESDPGIRVPMTNQEFFTRLSRAVIKCLNENRADGFVFRVDMRLRPYGESGALILGWSAMEKYYLEQGRDWERYAFIKARAIAGDLEKGKSILQWLKPFVYRKHLDYGAIESLRTMKSLIDKEVKRRELQNDIKLGPGGIREIEFIAQCHQLIWGGQDNRLQEPRLVKVLALLQARGDVPTDQVKELTSAYRFLRNSEHVMQAESDSQTQTLPENEISQLRLATGMGCEDWDEFSRQLMAHRDNVVRCFRELIQTSDIEMDELVEGELVWNGMWRNLGEDDRVAETLSRYGFVDISRAIRLLKHVKSMVEGDKANELTVERFNKLMPPLMGLIAKEAKRDEALSRVIAIAEAVFRRSTYIAFLLENPDALTRMVSCCAASEWIAEQLRQQPVLLYELTDQKNHLSMPDRESLVDLLDQYMTNVEAEDLGEQMDALRRFKNGHQLRAAVLELSNLLSVMKVSDYLTWLAEAVLDRVIRIAWYHLEVKHGSPVLEDGSPCDTSFAIIGYGKMGGLELGYGSDLDLVFIHECARQGMTTGDKPINNLTFFTRLAQRIIHMLGSVTGAGVLYEIDMRLRPSGRKGPLATSLSGLEKYQYEDAWTWEHQALVRARFVAGDAALGHKFALIREQILRQPRDLEELAKKITDMRLKMRNALASREFEGSGFDIKHEKGAIVDVEFMIQYAVLAWSSTFPRLCEYPDNYRLLGILGDCGLIEQSEVNTMRNAYLTFRAATHFQALGGQIDERAFQTLQGSRQQVISLWNKLLGSDEE